MKIASGPRWIAAMLIMAMSASTALAQDKTDTSELDALYACQAKTDPEARLACFDETVTALRLAQTSGSLVAMSKDEIENVERDAFGFNLPSIPRLRSLLGGSRDKADSNADPREFGQNKEIKRVTVNVSRFETTGRGRYRFHLANGQVWDQIDTESVRKPRSKDGEPIHVEIRKASFGSFLLRVNGKGRSIRVRRVE